jgi:hypothetical protein
MKAFAYLPLALRPEARRALLISYGVGSTAKALTDTSGLERIDVVDVSRTVIEATRAIYPEPGSHPLDDPRVRLHIEDGRFFLLAADTRFDVITAEPPPPMNAGVASLYSREYFMLVRARLAEGGVASHWLPAYQMRERDSQAIAAAFCSAFPDCTLWSGSGAEWILLGTRGARPADEEGFARQWRDPRALPALRAAGFERPEDVGVTFLAGADDLAAWARGVPPVDDDHPYRISPQVAALPADPYLRLADLARARERFARSAFIRRMWPSGLRERTLLAFEGQRPILWAGWVPYGASRTGLRELKDVLTRTTARTGVLWLMGSDRFEERAARAARERGDPDPEIDEVLGIAAMADRDFRVAEARFARAQPHASSPGRLSAWRVLALCLAGDEAAAARVAATADPVGIDDPDAWRDLLASCRLDARVKPGVSR